MKTIKFFVSTFLTQIIIVSVLFIIVMLGVFASPNDDGTRTYDGKAPKYTDAQEQAYCAMQKSNSDAIVAFSGINVPQDSTSGCSPTDLPQMGSLVYYDVDTSTPTEFYNSVNGKGFNEGYGYQCVAGFKEYMYALSGSYVAAAGGGAKGYATQQSQVEPLGFTWHDGTSGLQNGDWAIWTSGQYGHVSMYYNGQWFGQNQYAADPSVGNPFNLASISTNNIAGYYRPNIYIAVIPIDPPITPTTESYTVQLGDTLGGIALTQGWWSSVDGLYGDSGYAQKLADYNNIVSRGLIYPTQLINRIK